MHDGHHHDHPPHGPGHNRSGASAQWQTPHLPGGVAPHHAAHGEHDVDLVEDAFLDAFPKAEDPTSFLRLAGVPFIGETAEGSRLSLLRVEINRATDVGTVTPHLGGGSHRYDPLPAKMASSRETLAFVYFDGTNTLSLSFAAARRLKDRTPAR
jgi:hypothetical protein